MPASGGIVLNRNGSFGGNDAPILQRVETGGKSSTTNPSVMRQDIAFEGTFKPKTHLNSNLPQHTDEGGMPFGTFGGPALLHKVPDERKSYAIDDNTNGHSFYQKNSIK